MATLKATIVVAEDDRAIRVALTNLLELEGYDVIAFPDGQAASDWLHTVEPKLLEGNATVASPGVPIPASGTGSSGNPPDLLIFDVMMPYLDGLTLCRRLRAKGVVTPILMVTARTETLDRVSGLDAGADAYVAKPFEPDELLANVRSLLRRIAMHTEVTPMLTVSDLRIDEAARRAWRGNRELELTKTEFELLVMLARNVGMVLTHTSIYESVWQYDFGPDSKTLQVYISYLRRKLDLPDEAPLLHTVRGVGYSLRAT
jgi:two-component system, OmpR family, response regulator MprA